MSTTIKKQRMGHTIMKQLKVLGIVLGNAKNAAKAELATLQAHNKKERQRLVEEIPRYNDLSMK